MCVCISEVRAKAGGAKVEFGVRHSEVFTHSCSEGSETISARDTEKLQVTSCDCQKPRRMLKGRKGSRNTGLWELSAWEKLVTHCLQITL